MDSDEVRKRKEYAERKVKERHASLRKEAEERRKHTLEHRERVQSVLKREQVLLQKRMQQLNEDEERKKATLAKQHEATSRIAAITKSPKSFAFGSSTPRTLAYLDNLPRSEQQYDKKLKPLEDSSHVTSPTSTSSTVKMGRITSTPQRPPPASHRPAPAMTSMTSSMYVTSSAPPTRQGKTAIKLSSTTSTTSKRLSTGSSSMMTQSVYTPSRPATSSRVSMGSKPLRGFTPTSSRPNQPVSATVGSLNNRRSLDTRKPPMPRKSVLGKPEQQKASPAVSHFSSSKEPQNIIEESSHTVADTFPVVEESIEQTAVAPMSHNSSKSEDLDENSKHLLVQVERAGTPEIPKEVEVHIVPEATVVEDTEPGPDTHVAETDVIDSSLIKPDTATETPTKIEIPIDTNANERSIEVVIHTGERVDEKKVDDIYTPTENAAVENIGEASAEEKHQREKLVHEETSESHLGSSNNTSLADELISIGVDQNVSQEIFTGTVPEVEELHYPVPSEPKVIAPAVAAVNDLVDVFGNDFINQNQPQRIMQFDEDTDSGKASPTSSETSSTTDEVTPRSVIEEKVTAPRVLPIVRSAEDMARKEKEAREAEERKNRLAAILAKSRGMASPMTNTLPPTSADIKDSSPVTSPPSPPSPQFAELQTSSANASTDETAEKATNESGKANDVLARVAAMTNSSTLQKILQRKQGSNPSLQTSESTGGEIY